MSIIPHIGDLHFPYLMNHNPIVGIVKDRRYRKNRIKFCNEIFLPAHQVYKPCNILKYTPGIMPAVSFSKCIAPFIRTEWRLESTIKITAPHQFPAIIENVFIVHRSFCIQINLIFWFTCLLRNLPDTKICIGILKGAGSILINTNIIRHISEIIVIICSEPPDR